MMYDDPECKVDRNPPRKREVCIDDQLVQIHFITDIMFVDWPRAMGVWSAPGRLGFGIEGFGFT